MLTAMRATYAAAKLIVVVDPGTNTMKSGVLARELCQALKLADQTLFYKHGELVWNISDYNLTNITIIADIDALITAITIAITRPKQFICVVIVSNSGFGDLQSRLL